MSDWASLDVLLQAVEDSETWGRHFGFHCFLNGVGRLFYFLDFFRGVLGMSDREGG